MLCATCLVELEVRAGGLACPACGQVLRPEGAGPISRRWLIFDLGLGVVGLVTATLGSLIYAWSRLHETGLPYVAETVWGALAR